MVLECSQTDNGQQVPLQRKTTKKVYHLATSSIRVAPMAHTIGGSQDVDSLARKSSTADTGTDENVQIEAHSITRKNSKDSQELTMINETKKEKEMQFRSKAASMGQVDTVASLRRRQARSTSKGGFRKAVSDDGK